MDTAPASNTPQHASLPPPFVPVTSLIGREDELAELAHALGRTRLLTITGVGGVGKTRLALETAKQAHEAESSEVFISELASLDDEERVAGAVHEAILLADARHQLAGEAQALEAAVQRLADRETLLVLDNCEHVVDAVGRVVSFLLRRCEGLTVLATSRQPLGLEGETVWSAPPLSLPTRDADDPLSAIVGSDAGRLFVDRAMRSQPTFALTQANATQVARICSDLDGLPLAIELAAARARVLSPAQIADELGDRLRLLGGGPRAAPERQRTLRGSLDWSYELLDERERALLRRLAVASDWTREGIEGACVATPEERLSILDSITALVDRGLLTVVEAGAELRYRLLATVRSYALERLRGAGEEEDVRSRHLRYYRRFAAAADDLLEHDQGRRQLEAETPHLRAALDFAVAHDSATALQLAADLGSWWLIHDSYAQARSACARVLAATPDGEARPRAQVLWAAALLAILDQDYTQARAYAEEAFPLAQASGDQRTIGRWMIMAGNAQRSIDANAAATIGVQAVELLRAEGDAHGLAFALANLALTEGMRDRFGAVRERCEEFAAIPGAKPPWLLPWVENALAWADISQGDPQSALEHCERALALEAGRVTLPHYIATTHKLQALALTGRAQLAYELGVAELGRTREAGLPTASTALERSVAAAELALGDLDAAQTRAERGLEHPHHYTAAEWRETLMRIALARGEAHTARDHAAALRAFGESTGSARKRALADWGQGAAALLCGEPEQAHSLLHTALATQSEHGLALEAIDTLEALGERALAGTQAARAARLLGAAQAARRERGIVAVPPRPDGPAGLRSGCEQLLGGERCTRAWGEGEALSLAAAIDYVRRARGKRGRALRGWTSLTQAEAQAAELAAAGLSNPQISARLFMSRSTVKTHLSRAYRKLGVSNRTQLAGAVSAAPALAIDQAPDSDEDTGGR
jgi:predicted ATPase/DNA-binding CsgD family transcriptional regulator